MKSPIDDDHLKFENELKKLKLIAENGARFFEDEENKVPAEIEANFLNYIEAFEKAHEKQVTKKVKEILNYPKLKPSHEISNENIAIELDLLYELLSEHFISLDVIYEETDRVIYRFITEELLDHDMNVIDVPGMVSCFIYEEFHPNHREDLKKHTTEFVDMCINKSFEFLDYNLTKEVIYQNTLIPCKEFVAIISQILEHQSLEMESIEMTQIDIEEDKAVVSFDLSISDKSSDSQSSQIHFIYEYGYWYIQKAIIPVMGIE